MTSLLGGLMGSQTQEKGTDQAPAATGIPIQTSVYGKPIAIVQGTPRAAPNLIDYFNFYSTTQRSGGSSSSGGKGGIMGGGGGSGSGSTTYNYFVSLLEAVCEGPVLNIPACFKNESYFNPISNDNGWAGLNGDYPYDLTGTTTNGNPTFSCSDTKGIQNGMSVYGAGIQDNTTVVSFVANVSVTMSSNATASGSRRILVTFQYPNQIYGFPTSVFPNTYHYPGIAFVNVYQYPLGDSEALPNHNWVPNAWNANKNMIWGGSGSYSPADGYGYFIKNMQQFNASPWETYQGLLSTVFTQTSLPQEDADPTLVILDLCANPYYGAGLSSIYIGGQALQTETRTIPGSPFNVTANKVNSYAYNVNVKNNTTGQLMTCVPSSATPLTGQYKVNQDTGVYTFASADVGNSVSLRYATYTGLYDMQEFCLSSGLILSCYYDSQTAANSLIADIARACNVTPVWASGTLNFIPRSAAAVSGNSHSWTPPASALYSLTDNDFIAPVNSNDPVVTSRLRPADQINDIQIEYLDRNNNQFAPAIAEFKDQAAIDSFGLRANGSQTLHIFCQTDAANVSAQLQMRDQRILNTYTFTLDMRYIVLDVMDLVQITDTYQGISQEWVRILEITENDDGSLTFLAEEYPRAAGGAVDYDYQDSDGTIIDMNADPGSVNTPVVFAMPPQISGIQGLQLAISLSGASEIWGGCDIWMSSNGSGGPYVYMGRQIGAARMGTSTNGMLITGAVNTTSPLSINLTVSLGELPVSGTAADASSGYTAFLLGTEFMSYTTVTLVGTYQYTLNASSASIFIQRGLYGSTIQAHSAGESWVRIDDNLYLFPFQPQDINKTFHFKFLSFNHYTAGIQAISDVPAYAVVIPQPPLPPNVTSLTVVQEGNSVVFRWEAVDYPLIALSGYYIGYAPQGTSDWNSFTMLTKAQGGDGTEMTNASIPPGDWVFAIRAANIANTVNGTYGLSPTPYYVNLTVENETGVTNEVDQFPNWAGRVYGALIDHRGNFVPCSTRTVGSYAGWEWIDSYVPNPVANCQQITDTRNQGSDLSTRIFYSSNPVLGVKESGVVTSDYSYGADTWLSAGSDTFIFTPVSGTAVLTVTARYLKSKLEYVPVAGRVAYFNSFTPHYNQIGADASGFNVAISPGGTTVPFGKTFSVPPFVAVNVLSPAGGNGSATSVTTTDCVINVYSGGVSVGGNVDWRAVP